jgi:hypothetical protein
MQYQPIYCLHYTVHIISNKLVCQTLNIKPFWIRTYKPLWIGIFAQLLSSPSNIRLKLGDLRSLLLDR